MGTKDFNKGMEAGARPFEEKFEKLSQDTRNIGNKVNEKLDNLGNVMDVVIDDLSDLQKKELYHLNTPFDLKENLDDDEKEILAALLLRLSEFTENNQYQKKFIRSVNAYIEVKAPQTGLDISCIENIENINSHKIILQAAMEYLYLGTENFLFLDDLEEEIFEHFSVNKKSIREIQGYIETIYRATGKDGIAEKYGFVPEEISPDDEKDDKHNRLLGYDGSDISEACADQVNIHHHYVVLNDYLVYCQNDFDNKKVYCVHKQSGEKREISDIKEAEASCICGYGDMIYIVYPNKILQVDTKTFSTQPIKTAGVVKSKWNEAFPQCNEKYLVYLGMKEIDYQDVTILVSMDLETLECQEIYPQKSDYGMEIKGFWLTQNFIYFNDNSDAVYKFDLSSGEQKKIAVLSADNGNFLEDCGNCNSNSGQYGNSILCVRSNEMGCLEDEGCYDCLNLEDDRFTSILIPDCRGAAGFVSYESIYYLKKDSSIIRYNTSTGERECVNSSTRTIIIYEEGLIRKKVSRLINKGEIQMQVIGKWLYYKEPYRDIIHKISLGEGNGKDTIIS